MTGWIRTPGSARAARRFAAVLAIPAAAHAEKPGLLPEKRDLSFPSSFLDPSDGKPDLSEILDHPYGFFPLVVPITEPAVGYGAALVPVFIRDPGGGSRPDIWAAGAMATDNGTRGYLAGYSGWLDEDRWHLTGGIGKASVNLDFHGLGDVPLPGGGPLEYNLDVVGGMIGLDRRIGRSPWQLGLRYLYGEIDPSLVSTIDLPEIQDPDFIRDFGRFDPDSTVSSLQPALVFDTRDNIFTPTRGIYSELSFTANLQALGASDDDQRLNWTGIWYHPLVENRLHLGWRGDLAQSWGDVPFYRRPSISLRGAPAQRYQGAGFASTEAELRLQVQPRWSVLAFAGGGITWPGESRFAETESVATGGVGFRYLVARRQGIHFGIDLAYGEEGTAFYIQFGSAWFRP